jgi:hypothetical protein
MSPTARQVGHLGKNTAKRQIQAKKGTVRQNTIGEEHNGQGREAATHF